MALDLSVRKRLRRTFTSGLPGRLAELADFVGKLDVARAPKVEARARSLAHQFKGTGSSFGCPELTEAGAKAEQASPHDLPGATRALMEAVAEVLIRDKELHPSPVLLVGRELARCQPLVTALEALGLEPVPALTLSEAREALTSRRFPLVALDLVLPDGDGRHLLGSVLPEHDADASIVVTSAWVSDDIRRECFGAGVESFLESPVDPKTMCSVIVNALCRRERVKALGLVDPRTGADNRAALMRAFNQMQRRKHSDWSSACLAVLDLEDLAPHSEPQSEAAGEDTLRHVARQLWVQTRRASDRVARWDEDEFVVLLDGVTPREAGTALGSACRSLQQADTGSAPIRISGGVVRVEPGAELGELIEAARELRTRAEQRGGGKVEVEGEQQEPPRTRVLVVDDDELLARGLVDLLGCAGFSATHVSSGEQALELCPEDYSLMLLDQYMPGMSGHNVLSRLRAGSQASALPVLMLTAAGHEDSVVRAFELGVDDYVVKPYRPDELIARVRRLVNRRVLRRAA